MFCVFIDVFFSFSDINKVKEGVGDKFGNAIQFLATFIAGFALGFAKGWKLTLVILSLSPLLFLSAVAFTKVFIL